LNLDFLLTLCPLILGVTPPSMQARVERLKAAQLARKATAGAAPLCSSGDTAAIGGCTGVVAGTGADTWCAPSSPSATEDQLGSSSLKSSSVAENYAHDGAEVHSDVAAVHGSDMPSAN
jgi:hypothetical protein